MRKFMTKKIGVIFAGVLATMLAAGAAFAYWTTTGTGTGTAATGTSSAVNAVQTSTVSDMGPGIAAQPLSGTLTNTDTQPLYVATVTASITSVTRTAEAIAADLPCGPSDYLISNPVAQVNGEALVNDTSVWSGPSIAFVNTGANQDGCKLATVNVGYVVA
jgi:hypothetical protein